MVAEVADAMPAPHGPYTADDLYALPEDGMRHELLDGALIVSPSAGNRHQMAAQRFARLVATVMPAGIEVVDNVNVRLANDRIMVPDVVIGHAGVLTEDRIDNPPSAVLAAVEIVSPSSVTMDRVTKPSVYAEAGIPTYIRIELGGRNAPEVIVYGLRDGSYAEVTRAHAGETFALTEPVELSFDPADLLKR